MPGAGLISPAGGQHPVLPWLIVVDIIDAFCPALLGALPPASAIASMPTLSQVSAVGQSSSRLVSMLAGPATTSPALLTPTGHSGAVVLSSTLPPISAKLAAKVSSGQFVAMKELLTDNMKLYQQLESMPTNQHLFVGAAKPRLREVDSPLTWASCFLAYVAVCTEDTRIRNLLTYGRLVIREAQRHSGPGWLEYDKIFRQHAALSPGTLWHEINPSLHSCTVLSYRAGPSQVCGLCHEPDHAADRCALQVLQPQCGLPPVPQLPRLVPTSAPASASSSVGPIRRPIRQETLERICVSWNRGRCSFPACKFRHICASCKQRGHRAKECHLESNYKTPQQGGNSAEGGGDHQT